MTIRQFEEAVWKIESVRIVLRAPKAAKVKDYKYKIADQEGHRVTEWLQNRVTPRIGDFTCVVVDGRGLVAHRASTMSTIRGSYKK